MNFHSTKKKAFDNNRIIYSQYSTRIYLNLILKMAILNFLALRNLPFSKQSVVYCQMTEAI